MVAGPDDHRTYVGTLLPKVARETGRQRPLHYVVIIDAARGVYNISERIVCTPSQYVQAFYVQEEVSAECGIDGKKGARIIYRSAFREGGGSPGIGFEM